MNSICVSRQKKNLTIKRNYFMIYEGACTEPDYFKGIKRNMSYLGINNSLITLYEIPKLRLNENETNILELEEIAHDYIEYQKEGRMTARHLITLVFEAIIKQIDWNKTTYGKIRGNSQELASFRRSIEESLRESGLTKGDVVNQESLESIISFLSDQIQEKLGCDLGSMSLNLHPEVTISDKDVVCIVHDRDYHDFYFPDDMYDRAVEKCEELSKEGPEYRLIITYPKFELWLLMHSMLDFRTINMKKLTSYEDNEGKRLSRGPSEYVSDLLRNNMTFLFMDDVSGKHISDDDFDFQLCDHIPMAIQNSEIDKFETSVKLLRNKPGTQMGSLLKEMGLSTPK